MDINPTEYVPEDDEDDKDGKVGESARDKREAEERKRRSRLNTLVAITVAILATFMGICKVKDDNIVQAMQQAQADKIDNYAWYQARNIREEVLKATGDQFAILAAAQPAGKRQAFEAKAAEYKKLAAEQEEKKKQQQDDADKADKDYNALNKHDDQFDLSDALLAISISMLAVSALTQKLWMYGLSLIPTFFGVLMGLAGLLGWSIHPEALTKLLS